MHLVYRALEKEPVPALLPSALVPPSKRKKSLGSVSSSVPGLPASPPPPKDSLRSTPSHGSMNSLNSTGSLSPKHTLKSGQVINSIYVTLLLNLMHRVHTEAQEPFLLAEYLYMIYLLFIDKLIMSSLFNNPEYDYDDVLIVEIIYSVKDFRENLKTDALNYQLHM